MALQACLSNISAAADSGDARVASPRLMFRVLLVALLPFEASLVAFGAAVNAEELKVLSRSSGCALPQCGAVSAQLPAPIDCSAAAALARLPFPSLEM